MKAMFTQSKSSSDNANSKYSLLGTSKVKKSDDNSDALTESSTRNTNDETDKKELTFLELLRVLRPYFWPNEGSESAFSNRIRAISTWLSVLLSKACNLLAPFSLLTAADLLIAGRFQASIKYIVIYTLLRIGSTVFKELQSIIYVKVKQQASIELQELTFRHLHTLSLNWHVSKNTGSVMKSMDRGIDAVGTLITYLFLSLGPALMECFAVMLLFFVQFSQWGLGLTVFIGVAAYIAVTITITQWRKKFREATNKQDNDFHDKATDSIINFETVKYFTAESFEVSRFKESVIKYQVFSSSTSVSGSFLNIAQQMILWMSMLAALIISGRAVANGSMTIGSWIAVQSWVTSIFAPLAWLGSLYAAIVQAMIDIRNLNQLLSEQPDVVDEEGAVDIPASRALRTSIANCSNSNNKHNKQSHNHHTISISDNDDGEEELTTISLQEDDNGNNANIDNNNDGITLLSLNQHTTSKPNKIPFFSRTNHSNNKNNNKNNNKSKNSSSMDIDTELSFSIVQDDDNDDTSNEKKMVGHRSGSRNGSSSSSGRGVAVDFQDIFFHYPAQNPDRGLKNVSFHVPAGTTTAVVGHTGAGKTTISRLLFRFYDPVQGRVCLDGHDIKKYTQKSVRACIGIVPQDCVLFNDTILHNIKYGRLNATFEEVEAAAEAAHIKQFIESLPDGWDTKVGERGLKLSGGEKQRVAIARCLLKDPPVVLLDEATSALDSVTEQSIQEALSALGAQRTVLVIAHRLSTIRHADQIIVLDNGIIVERGTHDELLLLNQYYAKLWNMQIKSSGLSNSNNLSTNASNNNVNLSSAVAAESVTN